MVPREPTENSREVRGAPHYWKVKLQDIVPQQTLLPLLGSILSRVLAQPGANVVAYQRRMIMSDQVSSSLKHVCLDHGGVMS